MHETNKFLPNSYKNYRKLSKYFMIVAAIYLIGNIYKSDKDFKPIKAKDSSIETAEVNFEEFDIEQVSINFEEISDEQDVSIQYILHWPYPYPYIHIPNWRTQSPFLSQSCKNYQCYLTKEIKYFKDITNFDVILFFEHGASLYYNKINKTKLPEKRSPEQIYLFLSIEPSVSYPLYDDVYDDYFNFTCTYKLDSDARCNYFEVLNEEGEVIGPKIDMKWIKTEDMRPVSDDLLEILKGKTKLVAWIVSHCTSNSKREEFVRKLELELDKYNLRVDIYGECGKFKCKYCDDMLEKRFMFYLAFENAFDEDYVTEKVLRALENSVVPIVYGGANYTRFMPDGSYLNARELGVERLAATLNHLLHNKDEYYKFFKWRNHYSYLRKPYTDACEMCRIVTDVKILKQRKLWRNFREWWHPRLNTNNTQEY